jgi:hypothetical protein
MHSTDALSEPLERRPTMTIPTQPQQSNLAITSKRCDRFNGDDNQPTVFGEPQHARKGWWISGYIDRRFTRVCRWVPQTVTGKPRETGFVEQAKKEESLPPCRRRSLWWTLFTPRNSLYALKVSTQNRSSAPSQSIVCSHHQHIER